MFHISLCPSSNPSLKSLCLRYKKLRFQAAKSSPRWFPELGWSLRTRRCGGLSPTEPRLSQRRVELGRYRTSNSNSNYHLAKEKSLQHTAAAATGKTCLPGWKTQAGLENQQRLHPLTQLHSVVLQPLTQLPLFSHGKRLNQGGSTAVSSKRWMCAKPCRNPALKATGQAQPPSQPAMGAFGSPILPCGLGFVPDGTFLWSLD